jgi:hypothetical protein
MFQALLYLLAVALLVAAAVWVRHRGRLALLGAATGLLAYAWPVLTAAVGG